MRWYEIAGAGGFVVALCLLASGCDGTYSGNSGLRVYAYPHSVVNVTETTRGAENLSPSQTVSPSTQVSVPVSAVP